MTESNSGIGNVIQNQGLVEMAMAYSRSRVLCAAARLGVADALADEVRSIAYLAEKCQADPTALYRLLRALASIGVTEETTPEHFRLTAFGKPLRKDAPQSVWPAVVFWSDLLADSWSLLTECVRTGLPAHDVRDPNVPSRWSQDPDASSIFRAVMGTAPAEDYAPIANAWDFSRAKVVADLGGGGGSLILAVLALNPHVRGMLVDLEPSIDAAGASLRKRRSVRPMRTDRRGPYAVSPVRCGCVHAETCAARPSRSRSHHDSKELPRRDSASRPLVDNRIHPSATGLQCGPAVGRSPDERPQHARRDRRQRAQRARMENAFRCSRLHSHRGISGWG